MGPLCGLRPGQKCLPDHHHQKQQETIVYYSTEALNDDLLPKFDDRDWIVQLTLIWRPEKIIPNMASGVLFGQSINNCLSVLFILSSNFDERSSFRALGELLI